MENNDFKKTFSEYVKETAYLSYNEEDYLEAIYNLIFEKTSLSNKDLADYLKVSRPSVTYMINRLKEKKLLENSREQLKLTEKGILLGEFLLKRHNEVKRFLLHLKVEDNLLEKVEKLEHVIDKDILEKLKYLNEVLDNKSF